ncbi:MAG: helix-turn-helix transcriptional regulator, partial [Gammaproteobacteria bacterium]
MGLVNNSMAIMLPREVYFRHLQIIGKVAFTSREIDIIACVVQGRTAKKIAFLLGISPKTVENHLRNIMLKIVCYSKDKIIDFIEKSGKFNYIKYYYSSLIIKLAFETEWKQVLSLVQTQKPINCTIVYHNLVNELLKLLQQLLEHLKAINLQIACITIQEAVDMVLSTTRPTGYVVYCISTDLSDYIKKVDSTSAPWLLQVERTILLLLDTCHDMDKSLQPCHQVDLTITQNYYFAIFSMLKLFFPMTDFTNNINAFEKSCINLLPSEPIVQHASTTTNGYHISIIKTNKFLENDSNLTSSDENQIASDPNPADIILDLETYSNSGRFSAYKIAANGASEFKVFLQLVADGEQDLAEQVLKQYPQFVVT